MVFKANRDTPFQRMDTLGMTPSLWVKVIRDLPSSLDRNYAHRLLGAGVTGLASSAGRVWRMRDRARLEPHEIEVTFIVGHWRSGTTFLHHLLGADERRFQPLPQSMAVFPHLHGTPLLMPVLNALGIGGTYKRLMDNVMLSPASPMELEYALLNLTGKSEYLCWTFPQSRWDFLKYLRAEPESLSDDETADWNEAVLSVTERLARAGRGKTVLHKNPPSTSAIAELKALLPKAQFIFLHRRPQDVYRSTLKTMRKLTEAGAVQADDEQDLEDYVLTRYRLLHEAYFEQKKRIPKGDLVEVGFDELEDSPLEMLERVYTQLGWKDFDPAPFSAYLDTVKRHKKNEFKPLDPEIQSKIDSRWGSVLKRLGYN